MAKIIIAESGNALETLAGPGLREKGHEVLRASVEGLLKEPRAAADLILLEAPADLAQGRDLVHALTQGDGPAVIAVLPAGAADPAAERAGFLKAGADDCLSAPVHPDEFPARIETRLACSDYVGGLLSRCGLDPETNVYNRSLFEKRLVEEHVKASRYPMPLSCLLVVVDDLEGLKARHGAAFARTVLREIALIVQYSVRASDFVARCGPAEFGILLPFTSATDALICAERIRGRAQIFPFRHEAISSNATVSVGVGGYSPKRTPDTASLLQEARICLKYAQDHGGDQVVADEGYMQRPVENSTSPETLIEHLRGNDEMLQMKAYHALREAGDRATPALLRAVHDSSPHVRRYCVWALGTMAAKNAGSTIASHLKDSDRDVRAVAAWALGRMADRTAMPALIEAILDEDAQVRAAAALSIVTLSGNALKPNVAGTPQELRAEADACRKRWEECAKRG